MIKYFILCLSLSLFVFYPIHSYGKNECTSEFSMQGVDYKGNSILKGVFISSGANDLKKTDNSCSRSCILYTFVPLIGISVLAYYYYRQLRKRRRSIKSKDSIISRMKEDIEDINGMAETCKISREEILRIYRLMVQLSVSPQKSRHQKFLLDYNSFIYNNDDTFQFDWMDFEVLLNKISYQYVDKIRSLFSNLSEKEIQVVAMQKAGFEISDIAVILGYSVNTIYKRNSDIRKKLEVPELGNIIPFIDRKLGRNI